LLKVAAGLAELELAARLGLAAPPEQEQAGPQQVHLEQEAGRVEAPPVVAVT
jgi:hypothetical protein